MRIAKDDLAPHIDKFIYKEQSTFEHLLVKKHASAGLGGHYKQHRQQVWRESGPRSIRQSHDGTVDKRFDLIVRLVRNPQVVALYIDLNPKFFEGFRYHTEVFHRYIFNPDTIACHGCHTDERAHFYHVGQNRVPCSVQFFYSFDGQQIRCNAADVGAHRVQKSTQLLYIGLASRVVYRCSALGKHGCHDYVGRSCDRGLIDKHVTSLKLLGFNVVNAAFFVTNKLGTQTFKAEKMGV